MQLTLKSWSHALWLETTTVFLRSDAAANIYFGARFVQLLFEGGVFLWKAWRRPRWLDRVRGCTRSFSVLLSAVRMTCTTQTVLALAWWPSSEIIRTRVRATFTTCGYYSRVAFISSKSFGLCGYYSRAAIIRVWRLFEEIWYACIPLGENTSAIQCSAIFCIMCVIHPKIQLAVSIFP